MAHWKERLRRKNAQEKGATAAPLFVEMARRIPAMELPDHLELGWRFTGHDGDREWSTHVFVEAAFEDRP